MFEGRLGISADGVDLSDVLVVNGQLWTQLHCSHLREGEKEGLGEKEIGRREGDREGSGGVSVCNDDGNLR